MKTKRSFFIVLGGVAVLLLLTTGLTWAMNNPAISLSPQAVLGTGFSYQGYLEDNGTPANDTYDFYFELFDDKVFGSSIGSDTVDDVLVEDGLFTVVVDFGSGAFDGDERWLEISVRLDGESTYTTLENRQPLTPAPYAFYAVEAGGVLWEDIVGGPNGGCPVGSSFRLINIDGSVECEADSHLNRNMAPADTISTVLVAWTEYSAITIGSDGLPIIGYKDNSTLDTLMIAHCEDLSCTSASINSVDTGDEIGNYPSIAMGADGLPVISHYDSTNGNLMVTHCSNLDCSSTTTYVIDSAYNLPSSLTIGTNGYPLISYTSPPEVLVVASCGDYACSSVVTTTVVSTGSFGSYSSIAIGADSLPVIAYNEISGLKVAHCGDLGCTTVISTTVATGSIYESSMVIGIDALPIISFADYSGNDLRVAHCEDLVCSTATVTAVDTSNIRRETSITIGSDGMPVISYHDEGTLNLKIAYCQDLACTSAVLKTLQSSGSVGRNSSITIGTDGYPVISYKSDPNGSLVVTHCANPFCVPYLRRR
jgi:hypothetical protein